jgi:CheY-like chemotaxis protein
VLVVDDNPGDIDLVRESIDTQRFRIDLLVAADGTKALELLHDLVNRGDPLPHLVILDLNLPGIDGRRVLSAIKSDARLRALPVIVMSSSEAPTDVEDCYAWGANCYLGKPVGLAHYRNVIQAIEDFWLTLAALPSGDKETGRERRG